MHQEMKRMAVVVSLLAYLAKRGPQIIEREFRG